MRDDASLRHFKQPALVGVTGGPREAVAQYRVALSSSAG